MMSRAFIFFLAGRKRPGAGDLFKKLDNFPVPRKPLNSLVHLVWHKGRGFIAGKLFIFLDVGIPWNIFLHEGNHSFYPKIPLFRQGPDLE